MIEPFDLIDVLKVAGVRLDGGDTWMVWIGMRWNVYRKKPRRLSGELVISTPDINEAITAFVHAAGIRRTGVKTND